MHSSSYLTIETMHGENIKAKDECMYHNGEGHEGEEGLCVVDSDSEYDDTDFLDFLEDLIDYIEEELNHYVKQVALMEYECGRHGGTYPVADFDCQECGKEVCLSPKIYYQSENAVIAVMTMSISYENPAET